MSDYIVNPAVEKDMFRNMPFDSFAQLKSWSEEMESCRLALYDRESDIYTRIRQSQKISKYHEFVSICWNCFWSKLIQKSRFLLSLIHDIYDGYFCQIIQVRYLRMAIAGDGGAVSIGMKLRATIPHIMTARLFFYCCKGMRVIKIFCLHRFWISLFEMLTLQSRISWYINCVFN